jgi:predicted esterase
VLILAGERDPFSPRAKVERLGELLGAGGAAVQMDWQPGGHELRQADVDRAQAWLTASP